MDLNCAVKSAEERGEKDGLATSTKQTTISARKKFNAGEIKLGQHQDIRNKWNRRSLPYFAWEVSCFTTQQRGKIKIKIGNWMILSGPEFGTTKPPEPALQSTPGTVLSRFSFLHAMAPVPTT